MKTALAVSFLALTTVGSLALTRAEEGSVAAQKPDATQKIDVLERDLISTRQKLEEVSAELVETKTLLAKTIGYLEAQSKSAATMKETLDQAETAGFTKGINFESREILLRGWREQLDALQQNVPTPLPPKSEAKPATDKPAR